MVAVALAITLPLTLGESSSDAGSSPLTEAQANTLALARFRNYQTGAREAHLRIPTSTGTLNIDGTIDFRGHVGYGVLRGTGQSSSTQGLIQWTSSELIIHHQSTLPATPPAAAPARGWKGRALVPRGSTLDTALTLALNLGADRPENAQLLRQNGARWVGQTHLHGVRVDIMDGPAASDQMNTTTMASAGQAGSSSRVRYWIAADGTLVRVSASIATAPAPTVLDFGAKQGRVQVVAGLRGASG